MIWTAKGNKKSNNKAGDNPLYERANNEARDKFIDKCVKELGCEVKDIKTSAKENPIEKMLLYKGRQVCHCANRAKLLFTVGIRSFNDSNQIHKLHNQKDVDSALKELEVLCKELDNAKYVTPKKSKKGGGEKTSEPKVTDAEIIESIKERIANLGNGSKGIAIAKGYMTKGVVKWAKEQGYSVSGDQILLNKP